MKDNSMMILENLCEDTFLSSAKLARLCGISEKTVRVRIGEIKTEIERNGAELVSKKGRGYRIEIKDREAYERWKSEREKSYRVSIPDNPADREEYLLAMLLNRDDFIKYEDIGDFLFVSNKTLSLEIRHVEERLNKYHIRILRKPGQGIKAAGHEFDMRRCIMNDFSRLGSRYSYREEKHGNQKQEIAKLLLEQIKMKKIRFSEQAFENIVSYVDVSVYRMKLGKYIKEHSISSQDLDQTEQKVAAALMQWAAAGQKMEIPPEETLYLAIYLAGKRMIGTDSREEPNFIISEKIDKLVMSMLAKIYETFHIELRDNFNLRMLLNQHMMPLDIRMKYGILLENPLLENIRKRYFLAYTMAAQGCVELKAHYGKEIPEAEIGFLAVLFALALEEKEHLIEKKNILLVCSSGKASSQMLLFQFKKEFGDYLNDIFICNVYELEAFDLSRIDYIFSTVPIPKHISIPIIEIHDFLEYGDILSVKKTLESGDRSFLLEFYKKEFFFPDLKGSTKEEVLKDMCKRISQIHPLPGEFYESVLEREALGSTDYGNLVAIPHPLKIMIDRNMIGVGILEKPIRWSKKEVQLVVLVAIADSTQEKTQKFYEITSKVLLSPADVNRILESRKFDTLLQVLLERE